MTVLHIQTGISDSGNSVTRLHNLMVENGIDSRILCATSKIISNRISSFSKIRLKYYALLNLIGAYLLKSKYTTNFSYPIFGHNLANHNLTKSADIIYLHWTQGGLLNMNNLRSILQLGKPVLLSCRDFWYITGGCHSPLTCEKFTDHCGNCMYLTTNKYKDLSFKLFAKKNMLYSQFENLYVFVASEWMLQSVSIATLTKNKPAFCIANVLDRAIFKKHNPNEKRIFFNLPLNKILILFGAMSPTSNKNKGWDYLVKSLGYLKSISNLDFELVVFGASHDDDIQNILPFKIHFLGIVNEEAKLAAIYSACDLYVTSSLSETFGNTIFESLSCEVPVVSFNIGGAIDMIEHKQNGYLANYKDSKDFAAGIVYCLNNKLKGFLKPEIEPEQSIKKHKDLIENLVARKINSLH